MTTLHLVCGKIAAGKSTLIARLAEAPGTIALSQDHWLSRMYPGEIRTLADYERCSANLRGAIVLHIENLLRIGISVALDFPANTIAERAWMRGIFERAGAAHQLHFLDVSDEVCRQRLHQRNASGTHDYIVSDDEFEQFTSYFVPPSAVEKFNVVLHEPFDRRV